MKTKALFFVSVFAALTACQKEEFPKVNFPDPPAFGDVTYHVYKSAGVHEHYADYDSISPDSYTRKITFLKEWRDSADSVIPIYCDTEVTGDFLITVRIHTKRVPVDIGDDVSGEFEYKIPIGLGWKTIKGGASFTSMDVVVQDHLVLGNRNGCPSMSRSIISDYYDMAGPDGSGIFYR